MLFSPSNPVNRSTGKSIVSDLALKSLYLFSNPFRMCRRFLQKRGEQNIHAYGETPFSIWEKIVVLANITSQDIFCDFGCGRGRLCFWTALRIGCTTIGIDWVPAFIRRAHLLSFFLRLKNIQFTCARMIDIPLEEATVVYLYTFHPDEEQLDFSRLQMGARVISISEPIASPYLKIKATDKVLFPWGETEVFVLLRIGDDILKQELKNFQKQYAAESRL